MQQVMTSYGYESKGLFLLSIIFHRNRNVSYNSNNSASASFIWKEAIKETICRIWLCNLSDRMFHFYCTIRLYATLSINNNVSGSWRLKQDSHITFLLINAACWSMTANRKLLNKSSTNVKYINTYYTKNNICNDSYSSREHPKNRLRTKTMQQCLSVSDKLVLFKLKSPTCSRNLSFAKLSFIEVIVQQWPVTGYWW